MADLATLALIAFMLITAFKDLNTQSLLLVIRGVSAIVLAICLILGKVNGI